MSRQETNKKYYLAHKSAIIQKNTARVKAKNAEIWADIYGKVYSETYSEQFTEARKSVSDVVLMTETKTNRRCPLCGHWNHHLWRELVNEAGSIIKTKQCGFCDKIYETKTLYEPSGSLG